MTGAALLLTWFEPVAPGFNLARDTSTARDRVRAYLGEIEGIERLSGIHVTLKPSVDDATLSAVGSDGAHFVVLETGMLRIFGPMGMLSGPRLDVELPTMDDAADIPLSQWIGLRALIEEIHVVRGDGGGVVPISVSGPGTDRGVVDAVRGLLDMEGWPVR